MSHVHWQHVPLLQKSAGWERLPENGWGAVIGAAVGAERIARKPSDLWRHQTHVTVKAGRRVRLWTEPRSVSEQSAIDDAISDYLLAAGLLPRPAGFDWFIRTPVGFSSATTFYDAIILRINQTAAVYPAKVLDEARRAVRTLTDFDR